MRDLSLDIVEGCDVTACLTEYFENTEVSVDCEQCGCDGARKSGLIDTLPKCLMLHLKRFRGEGGGAKGSLTMRKGSELVTFGKALDLEGLCVPCKGAGGAGGAGGSNFELKSVVRHVGALDSSGHYVTDSLGKEGEWMNYNDSRVEKREESDVLSGAVGREAYLLMYERA